MPRCSDPRSSSVWQCARRWIRQLLWWKSAASPAASMAPAPDYWQYTPRILLSSLHCSPFLQLTWACKNYTRLLGCWKSAKKDQTPVATTAAQAAAAARKPRRRKKLQRQQKALRLVCFFLSFCGSFGASSAFDARENEWMMDIQLVFRCKDERKFGLSGMKAVLTWMQNCW